MKTNLEFLFQVGVLSEHFLLLFSRKYFVLVLFLILEMLCVIQAKKLLDESMEDEVHRSFEFNDPPLSNLTQYGHYTCELSG